MAAEPPRQAPRGRFWRRSRVLVAGVLAIALVVLAGMFLVHRPAPASAYQHTDGDPGLPVSLDFPKGWAQQARVGANADTFRLYAATDVTGVFHQGDWTAMDQWLDKDPAGVAGLYVRRANEDPYDDAALLDAIKTNLSIFGTTAPAAIQPYTVRGQSAPRFAGTLSEPNGPGRLQYEYCVFPVGNSGVVVEVMAFASTQAFAKNRAAFSHVLDSLVVSRVQLSS